MCKLLTQNVYIKTEEFDAYTETIMQIITSKTH